MTHSLSAALHCHNEVEAMLGNGIDNAERHNRVLNICENMKEKCGQVAVDVFSLVRFSTPPFPLAPGSMPVPKYLADGAAGIVHVVHRPTQLCARTHSSDCHASVLLPQLLVQDKMCLSGEADDVP